MKTVGGGVSQLRLAKLSSQCLGASVAIPIVVSFHPVNILLNEVECRVLGSLLEKEIATPEYYPLSLNALLNACNQKSNREPVVSYDEATVENALSDLRAKGLSNRITGRDTRVPKHAQRFTEQLNLGR